MSDLLWTSDVTWMQGIQNRALPGTAVIYRSTLASDGMGGQSETWAAVGTADARLLPPSGDESVAGEQITSITEWFVTVPQGTDITAADRIEIDGARMFEVQWVNNDESWHTALRCRVTAYGEETARE